MDNPVFELKGEMSLLNVLLLQSTELQAVQGVLDERDADSWQLLERSPVIVDCQQVVDQLQEFDFKQLKKLLSDKGLVPVGVRNVPEELEDEVTNNGWALLRSGRSQTRTPPVRNKVTATEPIERLKVIERPVRSGQQVYCPDGDIVVMQHTSAGSELLAGGSVHVYGALRGRVLAGVQGDETARVFCQNLEAELIAIAGRYRLLEEIEDNLKGQAVMVYLEGEKLRIDPI